MNLKSDLSYRIGAGLILLLSFLYVLVRASTVFYVHDECVTKWSYMIDWNFIPYSGYLDANNHLLNSLLGGAFFRIFEVDHILIYRLPNILAYLVFAFAALSFRRFFNSRASHLGLLIVLCFSSYLIEFFGVARGYGLSWAFLLLGIFAQMVYYRSASHKWLLLTATSLLLASYANLALLILSLFGFGLLLIKAIKKPLQLLLLLPFIGMLVYLTDYAFVLQNSGKFYLGEMQGFLQTSLIPLLEKTFGTDHLVLLALILFSGIFLMLWLPFKQLQYRSWIPKAELIPHVYLVVSILSFFLLNYLLGVRFPENRAAAHLILLFSLCLIYTLDQMRLHKGALVIASLFLLNFGVQANFTHFKEWEHEHFDKALLDLIPLEEKGLPPTTGSRFWQIDNEMALVHDLPMRAMQDMGGQADSLQDYMIVLPEDNPGIIHTHELIYQDPISSLSLFKRKGDLIKHLDTAYSVALQMDSNAAFFNFYKDTTSGPLIIQTEGKFESLDIYRDFMLIFSASEIDRDEKIEYGGIGPVSSAKIQADSSLHINYSYLVEGRAQAYQLTYYLWKRDRRPIKGQFNVKVFKIDIPPK